MNHEKDPQLTEQEIHVLYLVAQGLTRVCMQNIK